MEQSLVLRRKLNSNDSQNEDNLCLYCGKPIEPLTFDIGGRKRIMPRRWHDCQEAQQAKLKHESQERKRELEGRIIQFITYAGIHVGKYPHMTFEKWQNTHSKAQEHLADMLNYTKDVQFGMQNLCYLHGKWGTGKTHLAVAALRKITYDHIDDGEGWKPYFSDWTEHCSAVQQSWDNDNSAGLTEGQLWGLMKGADVLVIDDLDKRQPTEWAMGKLYEVIQHRYMREKPTIITANHSIEQLQRIWSDPKKPEHVRDVGGAILSRFLGQLWGQIHVTGPDQRES